MEGIQSPEPHREQHLLPRPLEVARKIGSFLGIIEDTSMDPGSSSALDHKPEPFCNEQQLIRQKPTDKK